MLEEVPKGIPKLWVIRPKTARSMWKSLRRIKYVEDKSKFYKGWRLELNSKTSSARLVAFIFRAYLRRDWKDKEPSSRVAKN